ncbi:MAG: hypothetical protein ABEN55_09260 [Bradymonadaceae bacterium]
MRRPSGPAPLIAVAAGLVCLVLTVANCAWGYAGQSDRDEATESETDDASAVEIRDENGDDKSDAEGERQATGESGEPDSPVDGTGTAGASADGETSPCGIETFEIHYFDDSTQVTKRIHCARRKVVSVKRSPMTQKKLRSAEQSGLPEGTWYVLVDPKGVRSSFLTNDQLIRISREYDLQFLGRDESRDLLIYEYRGDL